MTRLGVVCPVCGCGEVEKMGRPRYRNPARVAGVPIRIDDLALRHWRCRACTYRFQWPRIPEQRLIDCYQAAAFGKWGTDASLAIVRGYARKRELLERFAPGRRILDFGCFDGGFLECLGSGWAPAGIEPSREAADVARGRGVRILDSTIDGVGPEHDQTFDAIVIFDVMEHLNDPVATLRALARLLAPGGILLIETGDTDAPHWRLAGLDYWYCGLVEHVGFFNRRSIGRAGAAAGAPLIHFERSLHTTARLNVRTHLVDPVLIGGYYALRALRAVGVPVGRRLAQIASGTTPGMIGARDHFLAVLQRQ